MNNKANVERLYQLIIKNDECLCGIQWDDMYVNEYDTPQSIVGEFVRIFLDTDFREFDDNIDDFVSIANREERKDALIKFFETIVKDLKEEE
ncbi:hypothetical protein HMPREF3224_02046 [Anaerococcus hydrogenalis]|nr:hypothetical protein HMPREF3224_02046 [Anaerococcus hydrogenalis]